MYIKSDRELELMRAAGRIVAETFEKLKEVIKPGITTKELDHIAERFIRDSKGIPAFLGYGGYPASICASVNEEVVHGIPGRRMLKEGDIVGIDIGAIYEGYYGDAARTFGVGNVSEKAKRLIEVTKNSFYRGITMAVEGKRLQDISHEIQTYVESNGYSVVRDLVGHGIGKNMHEEPQVPNFGESGKGPRLKAGLTIAIEPMVNEGRFHVRTLSDGWTVVTADGSLSAHYENTIAITVGEPEILTLI
ncbi:MAG: type I methionyl aminopeptidase [Clostridiales bacterium]|nr:type I methionyl aminopeptidase [Clostridiales bacterium]